MASDVAMCHSVGMDATVTLGKQGRLVIPASMRAALGIQAGDRLHIRVAGPQLVIERPDDAVATLRGFTRQSAGPRSLVDELLAERQSAAAVDE